LIAEYRQSVWAFANRQLGVHRNGERKRRFS
jgi:hypothetical protein